MDTTTNKTMTTLQLNEVKDLITSLPNMREADITGIMAQITYIARGGRNSWEEKQLLLKELIAWGKLFATKLEARGIHHHNTNYASHEFGNHRFTINIYYTFPDRTTGITVESKKDFAVRISTYTPEYRHLGNAKTVDEVINILQEHNLWNDVR